MKQLFKVSESKERELLNKYSLNSHAGFAELHSRRTAYIEKKASLNIDVQKAALRKAQAELAKLHTESIVDASKKKLLSAARKQVDDLKYELDNSVELSLSIDELMSEIDEPYELAKKNAVYQIAVEAKKEHQLIAKRMYNALKELAAAQQEEAEFRFALKHAVGHIPGHVIADLSTRPGLNGKNIAVQLGDEKLGGTPLNLWVCRLQELGYML